MKYIFKILIFQRFEYQVFIQSILSGIHSSKEAFLVLDDCKMPLPLGHVQLSWFFFFISLKAFLMLKDQPKIKSLYRLLLDMKKFVIGFSSKSWRWKKCSSSWTTTKVAHCFSFVRVNAYVQFGFQAVMHVPFFFSRNLQAIGCFLLCRSFSVWHLVNGIEKKTFSSKSSFSWMSTKARCVKLFWNSNNANPFQQV